MGSPFAVVPAGVTFWVVVRPWLSLDLDRHRRGGGRGLCRDAVAGVFGAATIDRRILWVQALPGVLALAMLWVL